MLILTDTAAPTVRYPFTGDADRAELAIRLSDLPGLDPAAVAGVVLAAGPKPGRFRFQIDEVSIR